MTNSKLQYILVAIVYAVLIVVSLFHPGYVLENNFLSNFINHELVSVLAVTTSVTMAWAGHLVTVITHLENEVGWLRLPRLKGVLRNNILWLGGYFIAAILLLVIESSVNCSDPFRSILHSTLLVLLLMNVLTMIQTHMLSFKIPTKNELDEMNDDESKEG